MNPVFIRPDQAENFKLLFPHRSPVILGVGYFQKPAQAFKQPHEMMIYFWENFSGELKTWIKKNKLGQSKQGFYGPKKNYPQVVFDDIAGPIVIEADVKIEPFCYLQGPLYLGKNTQVKAFSRISHCYIGPECRVAGEISSSIFDGYSNKAHHGFVGHSYVGQWVNLGAGTTTSNLKNTYGPIRLHNGEHIVTTGQQFLGAFLADYVRTGINTTISCGSLWGLGAQFAKTGIGPKYLKAFAFETDAGSTTQPFDKFVDSLEKMMQRRKQKLGSEQKQILKEIYHSK